LQKKEGDGIVKNNQFPSCFDVSVSMLMPSKVICLKAIDMLISEEALLFANVS
jgi:hypothetical protein